MWNKVGQLETSGSNFPYTTTNSFRVKIDHDSNIQRAKRSKEKSNDWKSDRVGTDIVEHRTFSRKPMTDSGGRNHHIPLLLPGPRTSIMPLFCTTEHHIQGKNKETPSKRGAGFQGSRGLSESRIIPTPHFEDAWAT